MGFSQQEYWSGLPFSPPGDHFCQNSSLWPICLGWPCKAWLIASLSYANSSAMIRLPRWLSGKESACHCRRCKFNPFVGKIPWIWKCQPTPVFLPGKSYGQRSPGACSPWVAKSWTRLCSWAHMQVILTYIKLEPWWKAVSAALFFFFTCNCLPNSMSLFGDCVSFYSCHNQVPQIRWFKITETHCQPNGIGWQLIGRFCSFWWLLGQNLFHASLLGRWP